MEWFSNVSWYGIFLEMLYRGILILPVTIIGVLIASSIRAKRELNTQTKILSQRLDGRFAVLKAELEQEDGLRKSALLEQELYDRLLIIDSVRDFLSGIQSTLTLGYLGTKNSRNPAEAQTYKTLKQFMDGKKIEPAYPEKNLGLRLTFHLFRALTAMRIAIASRSNRILSVEQDRLLTIWETKLQPAVTGAHFPGERFMFSEQLRYITDVCTTLDTHTGKLRAINWVEYCELYTSTEAVQLISDRVWHRIRGIFDEDQNFSVRRLTQTRLSVIALFLLKIAIDAEDINNAFRSSAYAHFYSGLRSDDDAIESADFRTKNRLRRIYAARGKELMEMVGWQWRWEDENGHKPKWYIFRYDDAKRWASGDYTQEDEL